MTSSPSTFPLPPERWHAMRDALLQTESLTEDTEHGNHRNHSSSCYPLATIPQYNQRILELRTNLNQQDFQHVGLIPLREDHLISVVVPVFNEHATIEWVLRRLACCPIVGQIIVVNDASSDGTASVLQLIEQQSKEPFWQDCLPKGLKVISHPTNQGKGAALKTGFQHISCQWVGIQDADTEYDPLDLIRLIVATIQRRATVVYGSRYLSRSNHSSPLWHRFGNGLITWLSNRCTGLDLTDVETCYKLIRADILRDILPTLKENRFGIEIELTAKLARHPDSQLVEEPILYQKRGYAEGKKIGIKDGLRALWCMLRYRIAD